MPPRDASALTVYGHRVCPNHVRTTADDVRHLIYRDQAVT